MGKTVKSAIKTGFAKALSAIIDGNVTTLIAAVPEGWWRWPPVPALLPLRWTAALPVPETGNRCGWWPPDSPPPHADPSGEDMSDTVYKLQQRVQGYSTEAEVYQEGSNRINIDIPGVCDRLLSQLGAHHIGTQLFQFQRKRTDTDCGRQVVGLFICV